MKNIFGSRVITNRRPSLAALFSYVIFLCCLCLSISMTKNSNKKYARKKMHIGIPSRTIRWFCNKLKLPVFIKLPKTLNMINQSKSRFAGIYLKIAPTIILKCTCSMTCFLNLLKTLKLFLLILHSCSICSFNFVYLNTLVHV